MSLNNSNYLTKLFIDEVKHSPSACGGSFYGSSSTIVYEKSGTAISIDDGAGFSLRGLTVKGKTTQNGTPTPLAPVKLQGVNRITVNGGGEFQTLSIGANIGLNSIPDRYGNEWLYDELNFETGIYTQRVGVVVFDGINNNGITGPFYNGKNKLYMGYVNNMAERMYTTNNGWCSHYVFGRYNNDNMVDQAFKTHYIGSAQGGAIYMKDARLNSDEKWNNFFKESPVTVLYPFENPIERPISDVLTPEEINAYKALRILKGSSISNNQSSDMTVKYVVDAVEYIDDREMHIASPVQSPWEQRLMDRIDTTMIPKVALRDMPKAPSGYIKAGETLTGINYSSVLTPDDGQNLVGLQESLSTYYSALENPASVMYTQDKYQDHDDKSTYYGIVCSGFVSYVLGSTRLLTTTMMASITNDPNTPWEIIPVESTDDLFNIKRGDLLLNTVEGTGDSNHVRIVRDVVHGSKTGRLIGFNVSESWKPFCRTTFYSLEEFLTQMKETQPYRVVRITTLGQPDTSHTYVDSNTGNTHTVSYDREIEPIKYSKSIYPDLGDGGKYISGSAVQFYIPDTYATSITYVVNGVSTTVMLADMTSRIVNDVTVYELNGLVNGEYVVTVNTAPDDPCSITITS